MRMTLTFLRVLFARFRGRPLALEFGPSRIHLFPDGSLLPVICGADPEDDPEPDPTDPTDPEDPAGDPDPDDGDPDPDDGDPDPDPDDPEPKPDGEYDAKRGMRTIKAQRVEAKKLKAERDAAAQERDTLRKAQESEQERTVRELGEAKADADRQKARADKVTIDSAIRDAAADAGVDPKRVKRMLRLVDRTDITVDAEDEVEGAEEAVADLVEEFPEFVPSTDPDPDPADDDDPAPTPTRGNPDRKSGSGKMTAQKASRLAKDDPAKFADMLAAGEIPRSALGGDRYDKLKSEDKLQQVQHG